MATPNAKSTPSSGKRSRDASGNSPNAKEGKKKKGDVSVCPICTEGIVEQTKTKRGQDAIFVKGYVKPGYIGDVQACPPLFLMS